jgi:signal transduction histidine kinase
MHTKDNVARNQLILAEQVRAIYRPTYSVVAAHALAALLLLMALSVSLNLTLMLGWFVSVCAVLALYLWWYHQYSKAPPEPAASPLWARRRVIVGYGFGIVWGFAGAVLFPEDNMAGQVFLSMVVLGLAAASQTSSGPYLPANNAIVIPILAVLIARTAWVGDSQHIITAIALTVYMMFVLYSARTINRILVDSLHTRFENMDLIEALTVRQAEADKARRDAEAANLAKSRLVEELTEQKARAEKARQTAEAANQAKSRFLAAASHDLRQPLHALGLFAGALNEKISHPEARHIVNNINASVEALEALFNELLDISKLDAGIIEPNMCHFSMQGTLQRLQTDYQPRAEQKGLRLRIRQSEAMVRSDPMLLERILRNLVSNAVQYTQTGSVLVACRRRGTHLRVEVRDSGMGIPAEQREKIFEEFYQIGNPERDRNKGLGLGLAIVKRLERLLGCKVDLKSAPGRGSIFGLEIPLGERLAAQPALPATGERTGQTFGDATVLVVDDELAVRESVQILLELWGCEVLTAGSTEEAIELLKDAPPPNLIIADYRLRSNATGIEAIQSIQAKFRANIPGVLITGDTGPERLREAKASGFQLVHKPVAPAKLRAILNLVLRRGQYGSQ